MTRSSMRVRRASRFRGARFGVSGANPKAGVDASAVESCAADKALVKETMTKVADRSKRIVSVPTMRLNGKVQRNSPESAKEIKAALCKAGADAAC